MKVGRKSVNRAGGERAASGQEDPAQRRRGDGSARKRRPADGTTRTARTRAGGRTRPQEPRGLRQGPQSAPTPRPADRPVRPKNAGQAKARAKARKAKAPKAIRPPLRERLAARLAAVDLHPSALLAKVPFVVVIIGALAMGLGITLWLSTASAQRSYQLGEARALNDALVQQKEALERDVLEAQSAPALADAARDLGMIPSRDTAHLVQDPAGNWVVVGQPKPAEGVPPPPLNTKLPEEKPPAPAKPAPPPAMPGAEVPSRVAPVPPGAPPGAIGSEIPVMQAPVTGPFGSHAAAGAALPGPVSLPGQSGPLPQSGQTGPVPLPPPLPLPAAAVPIPAAGQAGSVPLPPPGPAASPDVVAPPIAPPVPPGDAGAALLPLPVGVPQ